MLKVLRIDRTSDVLTQTAYDYRSGNVYPKFLEKGFVLIPDLPGTIATRDAVEQRDKDSGIVFITAACHGDTNKLLGDFNDNLFPIGGYAPEEVKGRIVHFLACATAAELGRDFINKGCRAFIGYDTIFEYDRAWANVFFRCDAQIDLALAEGKRVAEAIALAKEQFDAAIGDPANQSIVQALKERRDSLVGLPPDNLENIGLYDMADPLPRPIS